MNPGLLSSLFRKHGIVACAVALMFGIIAARFLPVWTAALFALPVALALAGGRKRFAVFFALFFFPLGMTLPHLYESKPDPVFSALEGKRITVTGSLYENAQKRLNGSVKIPLKIESATRGGETARVDVKVIVYSNGHENLAYGDEVSVRIRAQRITGFKNPGAGDYSRRLAEDGVFFTAYAEAGKIKPLGSRARDGVLLRLVNGLRRDYAVFIRQNLPQPQAEIVNALSIGEKSALDETLKRKFTTLGIGHLFAISGLHVGIAAVFFFMTVKWLLKRSQYIMTRFVVPQIAAGLTIPAVFLYALLAGFGNSSVRAAIMATVYLIAMISGRRDDRMNALAAAAVLILLFSPNALFEPSFILSFSAVAGILLALNRFGVKTREPEKDPTLARKISLALIAVVFTTAAATMMTLPLVVNMFGVAPVLTFPANIAAMPIALAMVPLCIVAMVVFAALGFVPEFLLSSLSFLSTALTKVAEALFAVSPEISVPQMSGLTFVLFYMALAAAFFVKRGRKAAQIAATALFVCLTASAAYDFRPAESGETEAAFFDAGRKSIALFTFTDGSTVLVKGGFSRKARSAFIGSAVVSRALLAKRITKTDHLILLSNDHSQLNGAAALIENNNVENLWINGVKLNDKLWKTVENYGVMWKNIHKSPPVHNISENGAARLEFLRLRDFTVADSRFPRPVILKIVCGKTSFLLMESIHNIHSGVGKLDIVDIVENRELRSDVVFLPEITKRNKNALSLLVRAARPSVVVCRRCEKKMFGENPAFEIRETGIEGMVSIFTDGEKITRTEVFSPRRRRHAAPQARALYPREATQSP
ncbi:ComEC/Rec2 family competence protein [Candidatus Mycalebacterium sp.]